MIKRVVLIVLDSVGIGELPDASEYGDAGSNTLGNLARSLGGLSLPNLGKLGLGNIADIIGVPAIEKPLACYGKMTEISCGKDTTTGHWELAGIILDKPFPVYANGFPEQLIKQFETIIGRKVIGNKVASGTAIIAELGQEHIKTGYPIVYTSADSVFQIAAHEQVIAIQELYELCAVARKMLHGDHAVGRVIARPFIGEEGNYVRTANRKDFSLKPVGITILDQMTEKGLPVLAIGKIEDIFAARGITKAIHTKNNSDGLKALLDYMNTWEKGLLFTNLVDFDMLYGHRNDLEGYANALKAFDDALPRLLHALRQDDLLIITADHGCDPTTASTDHSREFVPLLVFGKGIRQGVNLGIRQTFADVAQTLADIFHTHGFSIGNSFKADIL